MQTFIDKYGAKLLTAIGQHIVYVVISVLIAAVIGLALAVFLSRFRKAAWNHYAIGQRIPDDPGYCFYWGSHAQNGNDALDCSYGIEYLRSLSNPQKFLSGFSEYRSELHGGGQGLRNEQMADVLASGISVALPAIFSGIRMSLIYTVSWAILAAMIGQGRTWRIYIPWVDANVKEYIVIGSVPIAVLAVLFRLVIDKIEKICVSKGLQEDES